MEWEWGNASPTCCSLSGHAAIASESWLLLTYWSSLFLYFIQAKTTYCYDYNVLRLIDNIVKLH